MGSHVRLVETSTAARRPEQDSLSGLSSSRTRQLCQGFISPMIHSIAQPGNIAGFFMVWSGSRPRHRIDKDVEWRLTWRLHGLSYLMALRNTRVGLPRGSPLRLAKVYLIRSRRQAASYHHKSTIAVFYVQSVLFRIAIQVTLDPPHDVPRM